VSAFEERHESILSVLQQETPRSFLLYLIENSGASQGEIANHVGFSAPLVNWHASCLMPIGSMDSHKDGRFVMYVIVRDFKEISLLLKSYYPTIWNKLSNRLVDLFLDISATSIQNFRGNDYYE
jgi:Winged helix-turn-helix DNA-binding